MPHSRLSNLSLEVLVVDDIAQSREALCSLVRDLGHRASGVSGGQAALLRLAENPPDVVILDLLMPDVDGFEVTRSIRERYSDRWLPVVVTSSMEGDEHFSHALRQGADDYLLRPVNPELLDAKLRQVAHVLSLQQRLAITVQRQRDTLDNILDAVVTFDREGRIIDLNLEGCQRFGDGTPTHLLGRMCEDVLGISLAEIESRHELTLLAGRPGSFPAEIGLSQWVDSGQPRITAVIRDLTVRRQVERMKDEFLAGVSHELRTPLTSILGALGLIAGGAAGALPAPALSLAQVARRNGERLGRLIDDLLDLTKLEGDRMVLHLRPVGVLALLREAMATNQGYADRSSVKLALEIVDETGEDAPADPIVRLDPDRFAQIMANLLSNAIKHTPEQQVVTVRICTRPDEVEIRVSDQGPGIDPAFLPRMFQKFSQADGSDTRAKGGTGLGLYLTRMLAERMKGRISAHNEGGAVLTVRFPRWTAG